jgi:XTP/dITP diphosphohydrolase
MYLADGDCPGEVIPEERGTNGFGYDAIFWMPELERTMAELTDEEKNRVSHRARAVANARPVLTKLISTAR